MFGDDFAHPQARKSYRFMDIILKSIKKKDSSLNAFYSTAETFLNSFKNIEIKWPVYKGDLFPYLTNTGEYWTGYYSTNVHFKKQVRSFVAYVHFTANMYAVNVFG